MIGYTHARLVMLNQVVPILIGSLGRLDLEEWMLMQVYKKQAELKGLVFDPLEWKAQQAQKRMKELIRLSGELI
jgi:hypothetical protein